MPPSPVITLTEALTRLAFGRSLTKDELRAEVSGGSLAQPESIDQQLDLAAQQLCDAGYVGSLAAFGIRFENSSTSGRSEVLARADFLNYRTYVQSFDGLLSKKSKEAETDDREFALAYEVHRGADHIYDVRVDRAQLEALHSRRSTTRHTPFSSAERSAWIASQQQMSADNAYKAFKQHPRYDGTKQHAFREQGKDVRNTKLGRPPEKSSPTR